MFQEGKGIVRKKTWRSKKKFLNAGCLVGGGDGQNLPIE